MSRYSIFSLARHAIARHERWDQAWRHPDPKPAYEVVVVGAGGHRLATACYLAKEHGVTDVDWLLTFNVADFAGAARLRVNVGRPGAVGRETGGVRGGARG